MWPEPERELEDGALDAPGTANRRSVGGSLVPAISRRRLLLGAVRGLALAGLALPARGLRSDLRAARFAGEPALSRRLLAAGTADAGPLVVGTTVFLPTLDPLQLGDGTVVRALFDSLGRVVAGRDGVSPLLARSWRQLATNELELELDPSARFSDGTPVTAADAVFSIRTTLEAGYPLAAVLAGLSDLRATGPRTLVVRSAGGDALLARRVAVVPVVSQAAYSSTTTSFADRPVGSGRYVVTGFSPASSVELAASAFSWRGQPETATATLRQLVTQVALVEALAGGQLDVAEDLPGAAAAALAGSDPMALVGLGVDSFVVLRAASGPFADRRVRLAANLAVDTPALVARLLGGAGAPLAGQLVGPSCSGFEPSLAAVTPDVAGARQLLAEAGYGGGFATELAGPIELAPTLDALSGSLRAVNIRAEVVLLSNAQWLAALASGAGSWPMLLVQFDEAPLYDAGLAYELVVRAGGDLTVAPRVSLASLVAAQAGELDASRRRLLLGQLASAVRSELPCIFLYRQSWLYGWRAGVGGMPPAGWPLDLATISGAPYPPA